MSLFRNSAERHLKGFALASVLMVGTTVPGTAAAWGESCSWTDLGITYTDFECLYDAAVEWFEGVVEDLNAEIVNLGNTVTNLGNQLLKPKKIADDLADLINGTDLGILGLDPGVLIRLDQAVQFIHGQNAALLDDYNAFAGDPDCGKSAVCSDFRQRLVDLLDLFSVVTGHANRVISLEQQMVDNSVQLPLLQFNTAGVTDFIENAPPTLLFPLYMALKIPEESSGCSYCPFFEALEHVLSNSRIDLLQLESEMQWVIDNMATTTGFASGQIANLEGTTQVVTNEFIGIPRSPLCTLFFVHPDVPDTLSTISSITGLVALIVDKAGSWVLKPHVSAVPKKTEAGASFGLEASIWLDARVFKAQYGLTARIIATPLRVLAQDLSARVSDCRQRMEQYLAICALKYDVKQNSTFEECKQKVLWTDERFGF